MVTPEERFYASSARPAARGSGPRTAEAFRPGARYWIIQESLEQDPLPHRDRICELGCGSGDTLLWMHRRHGFLHYLGIDLCIDHPWFEPAGELISANLNNPWPLADASCDVLVAMMVIEHLFDPYFCFAQIARTLSVDGRAFVNLPLVTSIKNRLRLLFGHLPVTSVAYHRWQQEGHWDGFHLHYFNLASIHDLASFAGLKIHRSSAVGRGRWLKQALPTVLCDEISLELRKVKP